MRKSLPENIDLTEGRDFRSLPSRIISRRIPDKLYRKPFTLKSYFSTNNTTLSQTILNDGLTTYTTIDTDFDMQTSSSTMNMLSGYSINISNNSSYWSYSPNMITYKYNQNKSVFPKKIQEYISYKNKYIINERCPYSIVEYISKRKYSRNNGIYKIIANRYFDETEYQDICRRLIHNRFNFDTISAALYHDLVLRDLKRASNINNITSDDDFAIFIA